MKYNMKYLLIHSPSIPSIHSQGYHMRATKKKKKKTETKLDKINPRFPTKIVQNSREDCPC